MTKIILLILMVVFPSAALAKTTAEAPHWSLEMRVGDFRPDIENWQEHYGRYTPELGGSVAYKLFRQLELGFGGNYIKDKGTAFAPLHGIATGKVTYELYPVNAFVLVRGVFKENQWLVPYAGGGWTRMFYREEVEDQGVSRGSVDGYHARAGIQLLLDKIDSSGANSFYLDFGVIHTYLFLEAEYTHAVTDTVSGDSINLGGTSWLGGFLFEF